MEFGNLRIKDICCVLEYSPSITQWTACNRTDHIVGIKFNGTALHDFGYQQFDMTGNSVFFLNQKDDYSVKVLHPGTSYSVHFTTYEPVTTDSFCLPLENLEEARQLIHQIHRMYLLNRCNDTITLSYLYLLCGHIESYHRPVGSDKEQRLLLSREYLDLHFKDEKSLDNAAEICGVTRRRFNDLFRIRFGITPNQYLVNCKVNFAKNLLSYSHSSVTEAAELSGFSDIYYFSKVFKAQTGCNPSQYPPKKY